MSIHIAFFFEDWVQHIGASEPHTTLHRWCHNMKTLGVEKIYMIDSTTFQIGKYYKHNDANIDFEMVTQLEDIESNIESDRSIVYIEKVSAGNQSEESESIFTFVHPPKALYVVGRDTAGLEFNESRTGYRRHWVHMPMKQELSFYADTAMALVLYARYFAEVSGLYDDFTYQP